MSRNLNLYSQSEQVERLNDVLCAVNTLNWDARTQMPAVDATTRGQQNATLMGLARNMIIYPTMQAAVDDAGDDPAASKIEWHKIVIHYLQARLWIIT